MDEIISIITIITTIITIGVFKGFGSTATTFQSTIRDTDISLYAKFETKYNTNVSVMSKVLYTVHSTRHMHRRSTSIWNGNCSIYF